ncbi:MAG TPA: TonB-dependent receptor plug domain-containing protein [Longimicrobiaceae bacterium]|nr:TonB-dependent receptor plug domain-containing protein [Longimicrobiaceae bacterium]
MPPHRIRRGVCRLVALLLLAAPAALEAQQPPPARPDTIPRRTRPDTLRPEQGDSVRLRVPAGEPPADTVRTPQQDTVPADSLLPAPHLPAYPRPDTAGTWRGSWVWGREALARFHGISLLDLLARIPGVLITRGGGYGQPVAVSPFGAGGGRTRVFLDGWEVDPLGSATLDLQEVSLTELEEIRVERRLDELRIEVLPFRIQDRRPFSQVEMGVGDPAIRFLRTLYSDAVGERNVVTIGFDITDTERLRQQGPFSVSNIAARWSYRLSGRTGVQLEYRQTEVERADTAFPESAERGMLVLRGRMNPARGLFLDAMLGQSWRDPESEDRLRFRGGTTQLGLRALLRGRAGWVEGSARLREVTDQVYAAPTSDLTVRAGSRSIPGLELEGSARTAGLAGEAGTELQGSVRLGPFAGASLFASVAAGSRGAGMILRDSVVLTAHPPFLARQIELDTVPVFGSASSSLDGLRVGAEWSRGGALVGASLLRHDLDRFVPFGLGFGGDTAVTETTEATGFEAYLSVPFLRRIFLLEGWYTRWTDIGGRPFLPEDQGRAALEFHNLYYTGNLEPTFRVEVVRRGPALIPTAATLPGFPSPSRAYTMVNAFVQVRVIDVRAFVLVENAFNLRTAEEIPGRFLPPARAVYGVRWFFRN